VSKKSLNSVLRMVSSGVGSPPTSSCGRLFDAVSYLVGLAPEEVEFEAEAPLRLEAASSVSARKAYPFELMTDREPWQLSFVPTIREIIGDISSKKTPGSIGTAFHCTLAAAIASVCERARQVHGASTVALVGGVFLNRVLLDLTTRMLQRRRFEVLRPRQYSPNDESISVGQVAYALARLKGRP